MDTCREDILKWRVGMVDGYMCREIVEIGRGDIVGVACKCRINLT